MANTKSAYKRINVSERNKTRNKTYRSSIKTLLKKSYNAILGLSYTNMDIVRNLISISYSKIDKAVQKGIIHSNHGNSRKSLLIKRFKIKEDYLKLEM